MLCSHGFHSHLSPVVGVHWPVCSRWTRVRPLLYQQHLLQKDLQELMDKLQQQILAEKEPLQTSVVQRPVSYQLEKDGENFGLILDAEGYSPEELSVRRVGRRLRVSGKTEKKQEDGKGSYSYRLQEFRQELDLPEGVDPEAVTCCLAPGGKLHIQAARAPRAEEAERELTIKRVMEEEPQQSGSEETQDTQDTQDEAQHQD